jgi:secreted PhoX family phosphatase
MTELDRRAFLRRSAAVAGSAILAPSLAGLMACSRTVSGAVPSRVPARRGGYGELIPSEEVPELWIPRGFSCTRVSVAKSPMKSGGGLVPPGFDGMAAFPLPNGNVRLIRNHEIGESAAISKPIGDPARSYDSKGGGGTSSLEVKIGRDGRPELVAEFVSLSGTLINCAGGRTPWGSWVSCEETTWGPAHGRDTDHGYCFEVPVTATSEVTPVPLKAMGRFVHEACAVDATTGIVYLTEDLLYNFDDPQQGPGSGFFRFIPTQRGNLAAGGKLQILQVVGQPRYNTIRGQTPFKKLEVSWIDIPDPDPANAEADPSAVTRSGQALGAAIFQRLEGCFYADNTIYFDATKGGNAGAGQVWQYRPTSEDVGELTLIFESPGKDVLDSPDNMCVSPRGGGLVICEDGDAVQFLRGLTPGGGIFELARTASANATEFAGCTFSPDGRVLFFNQQGSRTHAGTVRGTTFALWGPWEEGAL